MRQINYLKVCIVLLLSAFVLSPTAHSGSTGPVFPNIDGTDSSFQLFYYFDLRERESYIQVMNRSSSPVDIHVQVYIPNSTAVDCEEIDHYDTLTPFDVHIFNMRSMVPNDPSMHPSGIGSPSDNTAGFVIITVVDASRDAVNNPVLIGNFRIVDSSGFEYRTNAAGFPPTSFVTQTYTFNFDKDTGADFSDVVGIALDNVGVGHSIVNASPTIFVTFEAQIFDDDEFFNSCSPVQFNCSASNFSYGIDGSIPSSRDGSLICPNSIDRGFTRLTTDGPFASSNADGFVGFVGLNNGTNIGSMVPFIASP